MTSDAFAAFTSWAQGEREAHGFVWVGTMEADPRTPGPPTLMWARGQDNTLWLATRRVDSVTEWEAVTEDEWRSRFPYAHVPQRLLEQHVVHTDVHTDTPGGK